MIYRFPVGRLDTGQTLNLNPHHPCHAISDSHPLSACHKLGRSSSAGPRPDGSLDRPTTARMEHINLADAMCASRMSRSRRHACLIALGDCWACRWWVAWAQSLNLWGFGHGHVVKYFVFGVGRSCAHVALTRGRQATSTTSTLHLGPMRSGWRSWELRAILPLVRGNARNKFNW